MFSLINLLSIMLYLYWYVCNVIIATGSLLDYVANCTVYREKSSPKRFFSVKHGDSQASFPVSTPSFFFFCTLEKSCGMETGNEAKLFLNDTSSWPGG